MDRPSAWPWLSGPPRPGPGWLTTNSMTCSERLTKGISAGSGIKDRGRRAGTGSRPRAYAESGFDPMAVSPVGARGLAQFMPGTSAGLVQGSEYSRPAVRSAVGHDPAGRLPGQAAPILELSPAGEGADQAGPGLVQRRAGKYSPGPTPGPDRRLRPGRLGLRCRPPARRNRSPQLRDDDLRRPDRTVPRPPGTGPIEDRGGMVHLGRIDPRSGDNLLAVGAEGQDARPPVDRFCFGSRA